MPHCCGAWGWLLWPVRVLIGAEFSGIVRDSFLALGHDAVSCDLLPTESPGPHLQCDLLSVLNQSWDMALFFPPCTHLAVSGARWFPAKRKSGEQQAAIAFFMALANAPIERICIENPIGIMSTHWRKPDQIVQPFEYGEPFQKSTCLWLKNLPMLTPTKIMSERRQQCWLESPGPDRWKNRSRTYRGIASAFAAQWG